MGTTDVANAARIASEQSGLPVPVLVAMIQAEGPTLSAPNNPFDVTDVWANLAGFGSTVLPKLWNVLGLTANGQPYGVAQFSSELAAIQAWAQGLLHFSNYVDLRAVMAKPTSTVHDFYTALAKTGYAGNDSQYQLHLDALYQSGTGMDPTTTLLSSTLTAIQKTPPPVTTTPASLEGPSVLIAKALAKAQSTQSTVPVIGPLIDAVNALGANIGGIGTAVSFIPTALAAIVVSLEKFFWILVGLILVGMGLYVLVQSSKQESANG